MNMSFSSQQLVPSRDIKQKISPDDLLTFAKQDQGETGRSKKVVGFK